MRDNKAKDTLSKIFGYIVIFITCALYVLTAIFILNPTGKTIWQILADGVLVFCMGITLDGLFKNQGVINGLGDELMNRTMVLYGSTIEKINPHLNKLNDWCAEKNKKTYKEQRTKILSRAGLVYNDYFFEDGTAKTFDLKYEKIVIEKDKTASKKAEKTRIKALKVANKDNKKVYKYKKHCYWSAVKLKLFELYPNDLTSEGSKREDPNDLGQTITNYLAVDSVKTIITKLGFAIVFGLYGITLIKGFSWEELIYRAFQICLFCAFGLVKMRKTRMFITNDYRARIIKKINNLEEFDADIKKLPPKEEKGVVENEQS
jgi:hypothetical protein